MENAEISRLLSLISIYEDMADGGFKARAYDKASRNIDSMTEELSDIFKRGGVKALMDLPGIGEGIAKKIADFIQTGTTEHLENLKKEIPVNVEELSELEGIGPKTIKALWQQLKITNISQLEKEARSHKIQRLSGFGIKSEQDILRSIKFRKTHRGRFLLGNTLPILEEIRDRLKKVQSVKKVIIAGSTRRMKETIGDADFLVAASDVKKVMDYFVTMPEVIHVYSRGKAKALVKLENGLDSDLEVVEEKSFGAASQYFTGNKEHNVRLRRIAIDKGWKLNEYGLFKGDQFLFGKNEEEVYNNLGLDWVPPEMRENKGEVELAIKRKLPDLISYGSLKGDVQMHSNWSDGKNTIQEMAEGAKKFGLQYIAMTDHSKRVKIAGGLDEKRLEKQGKEIDILNKKISGITILKGVEVDVLRDGTLDFDDSVLKKLDVVGASIHSNFNLSKKEQTKRILRAIENPNVDIFFHPTSRLIQKREPIDVDLAVVADTAKETGTILEIDSEPERLDLKDWHILLAKKKGCKFVIDSDAHSPRQFEYLKFGIAQARRGWLEKKDVVNSLNLQQFLKMLKN